MDKRERELVDKITDIEMHLRMSRACSDELREENETLRKMLTDALPHIECKSQDQSNLVTAIGEALSR